MASKSAWLSAAALLSLAALAAAVDIEDCADGGGLGELIEAKVSNCGDDDDKCPLKRGSNSTISIKFKSKKEIKKVEQVVHGIIASLPIPFPLESPDGCQNAGLTCPLAVGDHDYHYSLPVKTSYPKVSVKVKWELLNEDKEKIICITIPAILK